MLLFFMVRITTRGGNTYVSRRGVGRITVAPTGRVTYGRGGGSGGGGGGGGSPADAQIQKIQKQLEEQRQKAAEENERQRQETIKQIESQKISGQLKTAQQAETARGILPGETGTGGQELLYLTPREAKGYKGRAPVWTTESITPGESLIEYEYSRSVSPSTKTAGLGLGITPTQFKYNQAQIDIAKEGFRADVGLRREIKTTQEKFKKDPESFKGTPGFKQVETKDQITYSLGNEYVKTLPSYKAYESYGAKFDDKGFLKSSEFKKAQKAASEKWFNVGVEKPVPFTKGKYTYSTERLKGSIAEPVTSVLSVGGSLGKTIGEYQIGFMKNVYTKEDLSKGLSFKSTGGIFPKSKYQKELESIPVSKVTKGAVTTLYAAPLIAQGAKGLSMNIKQYGKGLGIKESIAQASPIRFSKNVFTPSTKGAKVTGILTEQKTSSGLIKQKFQGIDQSRDIMVRSSQLYKPTSNGLKSVGFGSVKVTTPEYRYIGGELFKGTQTSAYQTYNLAEALGQGYKGTLNVGRGFKTDVFSQPTYKVSYTPGLKYPAQADIRTPTTTFLKTKGAGTRFNINDKTFLFRGGTRKAVYNLEPLGEPAGFKYSPVGYKFKTSIQGIGIKLPSQTTGGTRIIGSGGSRGFKSIGGIKIGGGGSQVLVSQSLGPSQASQFSITQAKAGLQQGVIKSATTTRTNPLIYSTTKTSQRSFNIPKSSLSFASVQVSRQKQQPVSVLKGAQTPKSKFRTAQAVIQSPSLRQPQKIKQTPIQIPRNTFSLLSPPKTPSGYRTPIISAPPFIPTLPLFLGGASQKSKGPKPFRPPARYQPSFTAISLGIKKPKSSIKPFLTKGGGFIPLGIRPIISNKGSSLFKMKGKYKRKKKKKK